VKTLSNESYTANKSGAAAELTTTRKLDIVPIYEIRIFCQPIDLREFFV